MKFGKEANNIEDPLFEVTRSQVFINDEEVQQKILDLSPKEVREFGIRYRSTLKKIKDMILKDGKINIKTNEVKKLIKFLYHT